MNFFKLNFEEERKIFLQLRQTKDEALRAEIIQDNMGLVKFVVNEFVHKYSFLRAREDDLVSEGLVGLIVAVDRFDPNKGARFSTYAVYWIRQRVGEYCKKEIANRKQGVSWSSSDEETEDALENISSGQSVWQEVVSDMEKGAEPSPKEEEASANKVRRTAKCIQMLVYLNTGRIYKISELAELLETKSRNIIDYKTELENAGYTIESIPGRNGGYRLLKESVFPVLKLTQEEKGALSKGLDYLEKRNDFLCKKDYLSAMGKVMSSGSSVVNGGDLKIVNRFPLAMAEEELVKRYEFFQKCINKKEAVKFSYLNLKNEVREHELHPYELFMYNNAWYVIGWSEHRDDAVYYKLNRIQKYEGTGKRFFVHRSYVRSNYIDENGFKQNGEWYHVEFEAYNQYAMLVQERIYGKNQVITPVDEKTTKVSVEMQNKENILVFVLGFGANIKVLEPQWLKDEIKAIANKLDAMY